MAFYGSLGRRVLALGKFPEILRNSVQASSIPRGGEEVHLWGGGGGGPGGGGNQVCIFLVFINLSIKSTLFNVVNLSKLSAHQVTMSTLSSRRPPWPWLAMST